MGTADISWDALSVNARLATMTAGGAPYGAIEDGAIAVREGRIAWVGAAVERPAGNAAEVHDAAGRWLTPGLIDCHTHIVHGGERAREFELRLEGASYAAIARTGGGIVATVAKRARRARTRCSKARRAALRCYAPRACRPSR